MKDLPTPNHQLSCVDITSDDVFDALSNLDQTKAPGPDGLCPIVLKQCAYFLLAPVAKFFNSSLQTHSLPLQWKLHKICPIYKKGDATNVQNYWPISLLCIISEVIESIIYNEVLLFVLTLLDKNQFGFLQNRSCFTSLLSTSSKVFDSIDMKHSCDVIYLDLKKVFNSVPHSELLYKLWSLEITGPLWLWFHGYLSNRLHYVEVDGFSPGYLPVLSQVARGSILGPLLVLIYINDLSTYLHHSLTNILQMTLNY